MIARDLVDGGELSASEELAVGLKGQRVDRGSVKRILEYWIERIRYPIRIQAEQADAITVLDLTRVLQRRREQPESVAYRGDALVFPM